MACAAISTPLIRTRGHSRSLLAISDGSPAASSISGSTSRGSSSNSGASAGTSISRRAPPPQPPPPVLPPHPQPMMITSLKSLHIHSQSIVGAWGYPFLAGDHAQASPARTRRAPGSNKSTALGSHRALALRRGAAGHGYRRGGLARRRLVATRALRARHGRLDALLADDLVAPPQVPHRRADDVHQAGEGEQHEQGDAQQHVQLVDQAD